MIKYVSPATRSGLNQALEKGSPVIYWMTREHRVHHNQSLWVAQQLALRNEAPLIVVFCVRTDLSQASMLERTFEFMWQGLQEVAQTLAGLEIELRLILGDPEVELKKLVAKTKAGIVITDLFPIEPYTNWQRKLKQQLPIPLVVVDAHNSIPVWEVSSKAEYGARTIRPKIWKLAADYHKWRYQVKKHPYQLGKIKTPDWDKLRSQIKLTTKMWRQDVTGPKLGAIKLKSGTKAAHQFLKKFITTNLNKYATQHGDPSLDGTSHLSAYFHFGQLSSLEVIQALAKYKVSSRVKTAFVEELIVRKELADNFCFYHPQVKSLAVAPEWAQETLADHASDKRPYLYSKKVLLWGETDDPAWNAAQKQLLRTGFMHGYMRMYWAKKILEWSSSPQQALTTAITLNDLLELDGRDPNGYVGVLWSVAGVHDHPWAERKIFGKIRYMNEAGLKRKFKIEKYIAAYSES